jgi:hypothetical protein
MEIENYMVRLPDELQREIYQFIYPSPMYFDKFKRLYKKVNSDTDYTCYFINKFKNVSINTHWKNYKKNPADYPEIQIQNFYDNHNLVNVIYYCINTRYPTSIIELLEHYITFDKVFIERIVNVSRKHFYRDYDKIPGIGKMYFWNDEGVDEEEFRKDIINIIDDLENVKTNEAKKCLYNIYRTFLYIYYHYW